MKIKFLGAAQTVTGSCYWVKTNNTQFLVDCGLFQGTDVEKRNNEDFEFIPSEIDFVFLTHSHLDHCGLLPKLYKKGFTGQVYMSRQTRSIVELMLLDSAKVQEIRLKQKNKKTLEGKTVTIVDEGIANYTEMLYETKHVLGVLANAQVLPFNEEVNVNSNIKVTLKKAGHVLGAANVFLKIYDEGKEKTIIFSGDLGNTKQHLDTQIDYSRFADYVVMESLYAFTQHPDRTESEKKFIEVINRTVSRGGNVIIPAFSLQRSQEIIYTLKTFFENNQIPKDVKVYFDSPLAIRVMDLYKKFYRDLNPDIVKRYKTGESLFHLPNIEYIDNSRRSLRIRNKRGGIFIAGNGMCMGGRVLGHLYSNLPDKRSTVVFVGFQAEDTLGREILMGAKEVLIDAKKVKVKCEIASLESFSAHADRQDLLKWLTSIKKETIKKIVFSPF